MFSENFNLGFHRPKKDVCDLCSEFKAQTIQTMNYKKNIKFIYRGKDREYKKKKNDTAVNVRFGEYIFFTKGDSVVFFLYQ